MKKQLYSVLSQISVEGELHLPGAQVELTDDQAAYLLEKGTIELAPAAAAPKATQAKPA
jgi:hypothetical protein